MYYDAIEGSVLRTAHVLFPLTFRKQTDRYHWSTNRLGIRLQARRKDHSHVRMAYVLLPSDPTLTHPLLVSKATLDIISSTAFGYNSNSLHNQHNELAEAYDILTALQTGAQLFLSPQSFR